MTTSNAAAATVKEAAYDGARLNLPRATPVPVPGCPTLYPLPLELHAVYRPVPTPVKASIWLFAVVLAALTTTKNVKAMAVRLATTTILQNSWNMRQLLWCVMKTAMVGLVSTMVVQDVFWAPSRVSVPQLEQQYWLPSSLSKYRVLNVATSDTNTTTIPLGVHYLQATRDKPNAKSTNSTTTTTDNGALAIYVNHGFGASALSWLPAMEPLADRVGASLVLGHDATGFGFTERPDSADCYSFGGSAKIGMAVWEHAVKGWTTRGSSSDKTNSTISKAILMGHSMGALATLRMALDMDPMIQKHVILVSPALQEQRRRQQRPWSARAGDLLYRIPFVPSLLDVTASYILRRVVGTQGAWRKGLELAWGNPERVLDTDVLRYQWPSIGKGWERGLLDFSRAQSTKKDWTDKELVQRVLQLPNTTVSVILATKDRTVSPAGTRKFFEIFPAVHIETMDELGHDPFEEDVPAFVNVVERVLKKHGASDIASDVNAVA